ncbi:MAG: hypothetical protein JEZ14_19960 [Marinilabiliaceae bacterium]|nr:hypothetical protein [Marinilabiliaceae bacterium]
MKIQLINNWFERRARGIITYRWLIILLFSAIVGTTFMGLKKLVVESSWDAYFLLGTDWYPCKDWTITAQYSHKLIPDYADEIASKKNTVLSTLGITKKLLRNTLTLSTFCYFDVSNQGLFNRTYADYALTDQIHLFVGYDWFDGDKGMFGMYTNNSEYWLKAKFSF